MIRIRQLSMILFLTVSLYSLQAFAYDLSKDKVQYIVTTSHLDTQWQWTIDATTRYYLPLTTAGNFYLFDKYPDYLFNFESAYHYMIIKQRYPEDFARIKEYVKAGNWHLSGGMIVACDVNVPSPESLVRQILYGNGFFQEEFGKAAEDIFLPDCFGFGFVLPTVAAHCGMIGFSTQKVYCPWLPAPSGAYPKPFDIGLWQGVDGSSLIAAINPGSYVSSWEIREDQINELGRTTGTFAAYDYMGTGDKGGACCCGHRGCTEQDVVSLLERIKQNDKEEIKVVLASSDQLFKDITPDQKERLVKYKGELLAREHGVGTYTSKAEMKLKNRKNELGAFAAECASVMAELLSGKAYPGQKIKDSWIQFLWHQMHDDLPGTSIQEVYSIYSLPDEASSMAQFSSICKESIEAVSNQMSTKVTKGIPVVVFNPLSQRRKDIVTTEVLLTPAENSSFIKVLNDKGNEVLSQILNRIGNKCKIAFLADAPECGLCVYNIQQSGSPCSIISSLKASESGIANEYLEITVDGNGDISSITDLETGRQVLSEPLKLELFNDIPDNYPQWEIRYKDIQSARATVSSAAEKKVVEKGPARVTLRVKRKFEGSTFIQDIRLGAESRSVEIVNTIDWQSSETLLKAAFSFNASNPSAAYDLQLGTIERNNNTENLYEVPAQHWADITDTSGDYGVAVLNDCKYGWDKPSDNKLRLTLIHSPVGKSDLDHGENHVTYAVYPHKKDWREGKVVWQAARLNQPLQAIPVSSHDGSLGRSFSLFKTNSDKIALMALKKAEKDNCYIIRLRELDGNNQHKVSLTFPWKIKQAFELNGMEEKMHPVKTESNKLYFDIGGYQMKTIGIDISRK